MNSKLFFSLLVLFLDPLFVNANNEPLIDGIPDLKFPMSKADNKSPNSNSDSKGLGSFTDNKVIEERLKKIQEKNMIAVQNVQDMEVCT